MEKLIRAFILSDNRLFREALTRIFSKKSDFETVWARGLDSGAFEEIRKHDPDVLVLDSTPFLSSECLKLVRERANAVPIKIVMVAMKEDEATFLEAVRQGACGYVPKDASALDVVNAVRSVVQGEAVCPPRLCKHLFDLVAQTAPTTAPGHEGAPLGLTRREEQLIPMIDRGLTNKEIAAQLNLSEKTVKNHVHRILRKTGLDSRFSLSAAFAAAGAESKS
jgi:two-component system, NarL family, nitrate/nitrite response regulator NarL